MTGTQDKIRGLFLAALMVMSVFAMTVALSGSVAAAANAKSIDSVTEYQNGNVEIVFNESVSTVDWVEYIVEGDVAENVTADSANVDRIEDNPANVGDITPNQNLTVRVNIDEAGAQNQLLVKKDVSVTATSIDDSVVNRDSATQVYKGEPLGLLSNGNFDEDIVVRRAGGNIELDGSTGANSEVLVQDTSNLNAGTSYRVNFDDSGNNHWFNVSNLQLSATVVNDSAVFLGDNVEVDVTAIRGDSGIEASLVDSDGDEISHVGGTLDGSGSATLAIPTSTDDDEGNYTVEVTDNQTGITVTDTVELIEEPSGDVSFASADFTEERGDVVNITVEFEDASEATVSLGDVSDSGYAFNTSITDDDGDGQVTLQWNTWLIDGGENDLTEELSVADSDDSMTAINVTSEVAGAPGDIIQGGTYDLGVSLGADTVSASDDDVSTVSLNERNTTSVTTWTAPQIMSDLSDKGDIFDRVGINITEDSSIAGDDLVIKEIRTSGLEGVLLDEINNQGAANASAAFENIENDNDSDAGMTEVVGLQMVQQNPGTNSDAKATNYSSVWSRNGTDGVKLIPDYENDTYYAVFDLGDSYFSRNSNHSPPADGDIFETNFTVYSYNNNANNWGLVGENADGDLENQEVTNTWNFVEADATINLERGDLVRVQAAANQSVSGTATVATGTELSVRLRTKSGATNAFLLPNTVTVEDGMWSTEYDLSGKTVGTEFTVRVLRSGTELVEEDGIIQAEPVVNELTIDDQVSTGDSVIVQEANLSDGGFVAIHLGSASGEIIGTTRYLDPGESAQNLAVGLSQTISDGTTVVAMAHLDVDNNERFKASVDSPYTENGSPVTDDALISVSGEATPPPTPTPRVVTATPPPTPTPRVVTETVMVTPTPGQQGPGFGVIVALIALVAAALLAVRRKN